MRHSSPTRLSSLGEIEPAEPQRKSGENGHEGDSSKSPETPTIVLVNSPSGRPESNTLKTTTSAPAPVQGHARFPSRHDADKIQGVSIKDTFKRRRCGVFANRYFEKGENIIVERPVFSCSRQLTAKGGDKWPIAEEWCKQPEAIQLKLQKRFRKLRSVPIGKKKLGWYWREKIKRFFLEYAFVNPQKTEAHIYPVGSHMNHACTSCANAEQWTESGPPDRILVRLVKPVRANEEVLINYNNQVGASLGCAKCGPHGLRGRLGDIRRSISRLISRPV
ncbi:uncharacterized protein TrAtP1_004444 [Trichoderma atroviride]|uniref:SET domain-containing protein n=1 Tax=Hypocrea atroviridis (strain ATCC 20476 / IMI 206040) TaxID=452589 RepID=G9P916_HYPAI|nr:uncharacterized protein TRIATDRAFT_286606 [Trichoderma atroviride IMI 206040]EHK41044.1 hypothetical protein TRIATDRAFT_286606 [Trichoderma atroviride IMI 206040]UKZ63215.1 hypothetical protein TrAtP1_004444 [Trichoderma atroviride]